MDQVVLRYAVLWHSGIAEPHFDFLVETCPESELAAWRSPVWPILAPTVLKRLKDHRRMYLDFEGELSERRGRVERVARGDCRVDVGEAALWRIALDGSARLRLWCVHGDEWQGAPDLSNTPLMTESG